MRFHEFDTTRLNVLFGCDLGWEYYDGCAELPRETPQNVGRICVQYDRLSTNDLIQQFKEDEKFDRKRTEALTIAVRELLGITPTVAGMVRSWD